MCGAIGGVQKKRNKVISKRYVYIIKFFRTQDISKVFEILKGFEIQKKLEISLESKTVTASRSPMQKLIFSLIFLRTQDFFKNVSM